MRFKATGLGLAVSPNGVLYIAPLLGVPNIAFGTLTAINLQ